MNNLARLIISAVALILFSGLALTGPVLARSGQTSDSNSAPKDKTAENEQGRKLSEQFRATAKEKLQQAKTNHKEQTEVQRQKTCEGRKDGLTKKMNRAVTVANQHKTNIDQVYSKVKQFHDNKQLNVAGYPDLTARVNTAQTAASVSINALSSLDVNVDCASKTVAGSVASFREAVAGTRDSLKSYRQAVINLITALKEASAAGGSNTSHNTNTTGR